MSAKVRQAFLREASSTLNYLGQDWVLVRSHAADLMKALNRTAPEISFNREMGVVLSALLFTGAALRQTSQIARKLERSKGVNCVSPVKVRSLIGLLEGVLLKAEPIERERGFFMDEYSGVKEFREALGRDLARAAGAADAFNAHLYPYGERALRDLALHLVAYTVAGAERPETLEFMRKQN